jgi:hypothetical protein
MAAEEKLAVDPEIFYIFYCHQLLGPKPEVAREHHKNGTKIAIAFRWLQAINSEKPEC